MANPIIESFSFFVTAGQYKQEYTARYDHDGNVTFLVQDPGDVKAYPVRPHERIVSFAQSLRGRARSLPIAHLNLNKVAEEEAALEWLNESDPIKHCFDRLNRMLQRLSLYRVQGEQILVQIADLVQKGRRLRRDSRAADLELERAAGIRAEVHTRIEDWMRLLPELRRQRVNDGHVLTWIADMVQLGRQLTEELRSAELAVNQADAIRAEVDSRVNNWLRKIDALEAIANRDEDEPPAYLGIAA